MIQRDFAIACLIKWQWRCDFVLPTVSVEGVFSFRTSTELEQAIFDASVAEYRRAKELAA